VSNSWLGITPASVFLSAFTITMNRIFVHLLRVRATDLLSSCDGLSLCTRCV
jgi:hypothetical protein